VVIVIVLENSELDQQTSEFQAPLKYSRSFLAAFVEVRFAVHHETGIRLSYVTRLLQLLFSQCSKFRRHPAKTIRVIMYIESSKAPRNTNAPMDSSVCGAFTQWVLRCSAVPSERHLSASPPAMTAAHPTPFVRLALFSWVYAAAAASFPRAPFLPPAFSSARSLCAGCGVEGLWQHCGRGCPLANGYRPQPTPVTLERCSPDQPL